MEESVLRDIGVYKTRLISALLDSTDILELMLGKDYTEDDIDNIVYDQVFPYLYINETQDTVKSFLCFDVGITRVPTTTIKNIKIIIRVYCHKECMTYSKKGYLGTRADILSDMVEQKLHNSDNFGIGKLQLESVMPIFLEKTYYGKEMIFTTPDFRNKRKEIK